MNIFWLSGRNFLVFFSPVNQSKKIPFNFVSTINIRLLYCFYMFYILVFIWVFSRDVDSFGPRGKSLDTPDVREVEQQSRGWKEKLQEWNLKQTDGKRGEARQASEGGAASGQRCICLALLIADETQSGDTERGGGISKAEKHEQKIRRDLRPWNLLWFQRSGDSPNSPWI